MIGAKRADTTALGMRAQVTVRSFTVVPTRSGVLRDLREREILDLMSARLAAVSLSGYIFFGSSVSISDQARHSHAFSNVVWSG